MSESGRLAGSHVWRRAMAGRVEIRGPFGRNEYQRLVARRQAVQAMALKARAEQTAQELIKLAMTPGGKRALRYVN